MDRSIDRLPVSWSRQVLNVRSVDTTEVGLTAGSATNLIAVDAQRLMDTAGSLHELWSLPVQVCGRNDDRSRDDLPRHDH